MTIADARCYQYRLPLAAPLHLGSRAISERCGVLLRIEGEEGAVGWGDAAPLPGFSKESVDTAVEALRQRAGELVGTSLSGNLDGLLEECGSLRSPPSVQFAVEAAAVELLLSRPDGQEVIGTIGRANKPVHLNALISAEEDQLEQEGKRLRRTGFNAVKMKVGRQPITTDVRRVQALRRGLGPEIDLRLDANRAWKMDEAVAFSKKLGNMSFAYIEEPLADPSRLLSYVDKTHRPVALDETTREITPNELLQSGSIAAVVLKPTLLGGVGCTRHWSRTARERDAVPVISASHESGVGLRMLVRLASAFSDVPAGLSTYSGLAQDVLKPRLRLDRCTVTCDDLYASSVDISRLESLDKS